MTRVPLVGPLAPQSNPLPMYIADLYVATIVGQANTLVDYYVQAIDSLGNSANSAITHVYVAAQV